MSSLEYLDLARSWYAQERIALKTGQRENAYHYNTIARKYYAMSIAADQAVDDRAASY